MFPAVGLGVVILPTSTSNGDPLLATLQAQISSSTSLCAPSPLTHFASGSQAGSLHWSTQTLRENYKSTCPEWQNWGVRAMPDRLIAPLRMRKGDPFWRNLSHPAPLLPSLGSTTEVKPSQLPCARSLGLLTRARELQPLCCDEGWGRENWAEPGWPRGQSRFLLLGWGARQRDERMAPGRM